MGIVQRLFADAFEGAPFAPILETLLPGMPLAALDAVLAFSAFRLLLALLDGLLPCGRARLRPLRAALLDDVERGADDAALLLDRAAGALFSDFLRVE